MAHVSRPLIALLIATVAFFALWVIALKPSGSGGGSGAGTSQGLGRYQGDINAAHKAVQTANAASARAGADPTTAGSTSGPAARATVHSASAPRVTKAPATTVRRASATPARHATPAASRLTSVERALHAHKVLALLFYNPAAADDQAVRQELGTVGGHGGRVFELAIPLDEIGSYTAVTDQVPVNVSPTLVLVAGNGQAEEIVGYTDPFEVAQRVDDALAVR
jgi:hypothetical protein